MGREETNKEIEKLTGIKIGFGERRFEIPVDILRDALDQATKARMGTAVIYWDASNGIFRYSGEARRDKTGHRLDVPNHNREGGD